MFDHIGFRVRDVEASRKFYLAALAPLGVGVAMEHGRGVGLGRGGKPQLWLSQGEPPASPLHIAFAARNRAEVDAFHAAAPLSFPPAASAAGLRPHYHSNYYGAFAIDPDGHNIEAVCHSAAP